MSYQTFVKNGFLLPMSDAVVRLDSIEYAYGFGVYENIRVVRDRPLFVTDHIERLMHSANVIGLLHPLSEENIREWISMLIREIPDDAWNIKMLLIGGKSAEEATLHILPLKPHFPDKRLYRDGVHVTLASYERLFPQAKTLNMLGSFLAYRDAKKVGAYDALLVKHADTEPPCLTLSSPNAECSATSRRVNPNGEITEGTRTNFFLIEHGTLITAPLKDVLLGVTMKHVMEIAKAEGMQIRHEPITMERVQRCEGAFLTSTSSKIMPINKVGEYQLQIPENLRVLIKAFDEYLKKSEF
ncbi:MAG: aminotransferase class IV [Candidatus Peribacteraceae bacterium]